MGVEGAELGRLRLLLMQLVELLPRLLVQLQAPIQSPPIQITLPSPPPSFPRRRLTPCGDSTRPGCRQSADREA